jgi:hypothetical protein
MLKNADSVRHALGDVWQRSLLVDGALELLVSSTLNFAEGDRSCAFRPEHVVHFPLKKVGPWPWSLGFDIYTIEAIQLSASTYLPAEDGKLGALSQRTIEEKQNCSPSL